jgi:hypothetical protein
MSFNIKDMERKKALIQIAVEESNSYGLKRVK